jgi:hypothetical protein
MSELHAIAEVPERGAPPAIAAIYAEMRAALEMPLVNLIYRHFATHPGFLPWAWSVARPLAASGALQALAGRLRDAVREHVAPYTPAPASHGLDAAAVQAIHQLVEFYNRGNCMNVLVMTVLLRALDAPPGTGASAPTRVAGPAPHRVPAIPPIPALEALSEEDRALVAELNYYGEPGEPAALASLYRHAALWPGCLVSWRALLAPLERQGLLAAARRFTAERATTLAAGLALPRALAAPPPVAPRLRAIIEGFASVTICKMIPIGLLLAPAFDDRRAPGV